MCLVRYINILNWTRYRRFSNPERNLPEAPHVLSRVVRLSNLVALYGQVAILPESRIQSMRFTLHTTLGPIQGLVRSFIAPNLRSACSFIDPAYRRTD